MNLRKFLTLLPALIALGPLGVAAAAGFGRFGGTLAEAKATDFFHFFHLEQTERDGSRICFQPTAPKFHDLVKLTVDATDGSIHEMRLAIRRTFIDGADAAFARDIAKSFLEASTYGNGPNYPEAAELINQIWNSPSGTRNVIRIAGPAPNVPAEPTPSYRVFLGKDGYWSAKVGDFLSLSLENRVNAGDAWLFVAVSPIAKPCCAVVRAPMPPPVR